MKSHFGHTFNILFHTLGPKRVLGTLRRAGPGAQEAPTSGPRPASGCQGSLGDPKPGKRKQKYAQSVNSYFWHTFGILSAYFRHPFCVLLAYAFFYNTFWIPLAYAFFCILSVILFRAKSGFGYGA